MRSDPETIHSPHAQDMPLRQWAKFALGGLFATLFFCLREALTGADAEQQFTRLACTAMACFTGSVTVVTLTKYLQQHLKKESLAKKLEVFVAILVTGTVYYTNQAFFTEVPLWQRTLLLFLLVPQITLFLPLLNNPLLKPLLSKRSRYPG